MANVVLWLSSLPAVMGIVVFLLGCYFAFRRHKKGVLKVKLPVVGELSTETLGIAFIVLAFPFLLVAQDFYVTERKLIAAQQAARQAEEAARQAAALVSYASLMQVSERAPLFKSMARSMRQEIPTIGRSSGEESLAALNRMQASAQLLLRIDPENGHGTYFLGEALRLRQASDSEVRSHGEFRRYVSFACRRSKVSFTNRSNANACYESGEGYCAERIAWVLHLLANSYYRDALRATDASRRQAAMQTAYNDAEAALKIWGQPFVHTSKSENLTTTLVRDGARAELKGAVAPAPPCN